MKKLSSIILTVALLSSANSAFAQSSSRRSIAVLSYIGMVSVGLVLFAVMQINEEFQCSLNDIELCCQPNPQFDGQKLVDNCTQVPVQACKEQAKCFNKKRSYNAPLVMKPFWAKCLLDIGSVSAVISSIAVNVLILKEIDVI